MLPISRKIRIWLTILICYSLFGCRIITVRKENSPKNAVTGGAIGAALGAGLAGTAGVFGGGILGSSVGSSIGEATGRDIIILEDIRGKKMFADKMRQVFKELDISEGYTKTIMKKIEETELLFPGSLYWLDKKNQLLRHQKSKNVIKK